MLEKGARETYKELKDKTEESKSKAAVAMEKVGSFLAE